METLVAVLKQAHLDFTFGDALIGRQKTQICNGPFLFDKSV